MHARSCGRHRASWTLFGSARNSRGDYRRDPGFRGAQPVDCLAGRGLTLAGRTPPQGTGALPAAVWSSRLWEGGRGPSVLGVCAGSLSGLGNPHKGAPVPRLSL